MSWSEDFVKLLQSLSTAIKTTKCQSSLSTPCRCSSRYPYTGTLRRCHYTIVTLYFSVQPSSICRCTTMGEVWHHDSISTKRYWHLMSCTPVDIYILLIFVHLSCTWACRSYSSLLSIFLSKFLSKFELSYSYVHYRVSSYLSVLGCQVQSFWGFIILLCTIDIWLAGCHLASSWCHA